MSLKYGEKSIEACINIPKTEGSEVPYGILLTHGAGGDMNLSQLTQLAEYLASKGIVIVRFTCKGLNLVYRVKVYEQVLQQISDLYKNTQFFLGGRSMGARAAVGVANTVKGLDLEHVVAGVIAISYPLHTKDNHDDLRDGPLYDLQKPVCFISGNRDEMCETSIFMEVLENAAVDSEKDVYWIDGADHALKVKGMKEGDVVEKMGHFIVDWCNRMMKVKIKDGNDSIKARESTKTNGKRKEDGGSSTLRSKRQKQKKK